MPAAYSPTFVEKYRLEEFKAARVEIERHLTDMRSLERQVLVGDAAIYAALLFRENPIADKSLLSLAWWLPPMIGLLALSRWRSSSEMVGRLGAYIRQNEPDGQGWETFLLALRRSRIPGMRFFWNILYWMTTIGGVGAIACYETTMNDPRQTTLAIFAGIALGLTAIAMSIQNPPGERISPRE
jgi:hypothetical protein